MKDLLVLLAHLLTTIAKLPGPGGAKAIVELKQRNPRFGCRRIAQQIAKAFEVDIDKDLVRRVLTEHYRPGSNDGGPSWLTFIERLIGTIRREYLDHTLLEHQRPGEEAGRISAVLQRSSCAHFARRRYTVRNQQRSHHPPR